jgi:hypothetical protein
VLPPLPGKDRTPSLPTGEPSLPLGPTYREIFGTSCSFSSELAAVSSLEPRTNHQPGKLQVRSPTGMHGQNMAFGDGVALALCSPPRLLSRCGSMLRCAPAPVPVEARLSIRPFTLRQRRLTFRSVSAAGLTLLACIFEAIPKSPLGPFGFALPP